MYRIEVSPGEETVFRTIDELATGIRNGVITSRSRIYHGASAKWLPIEFHPHYKQAVEVAAHPGSATEQAHAAPAAPAANPGRTKRSTSAPAHWHSAAVPSIEPTPTPLPAVAALPPAAPPTPPVEQAMVLPRISYPEVPREDPRPEQPLFRGRRRMGGKPLLLAAAAIVVAVGARFMLAAAPPAEEPELPIATLGSSPPHVPEPPAAVPAPKPAATKPAATPAPAPAPPRAAPALRLEPAAPSVPGPAFAPALPSGSAPPVPKPSGRPFAQAKAVALVGDSVPAPLIEPAPAQIDLALPGTVPSTDSISVVSKSADSNAIRRILKAVTGSKAQPTKAGAP
jgi:hypothetical protein